MRRGTTRRVGRGLGAIAILLSAAILPAVTPSASAARNVTLDLNAASPCQDVAFVGARGSGESLDGNWGMGDKVSWAYVKYLEGVSGRRIGFYGVPYVAHDAKALLFPSTRKQFFSGIDSGIQMTMSLLRQRQKRCPSEKVILAGYSQGAMVMHRVVWELDRSTDRVHGQLLRDRVTAVLAIADGDRHWLQGGQRYGTRTTTVAGHDRGVAFNTFGVGHGSRNQAQARRLPNWSQRLFHSICDAGDIVCDWGRTVRLLNGVTIHTSRYNPGSGVTRAAQVGAARTMHIPAVDEFAITGTLQAGIAGESYVSKFTSRGGANPIAWTASGLPAGLTVGAGGQVVGTPAVAGLFDVGVRATDRNGQTVRRTLLLHVRAPQDEEPDSPPSGPVVLASRELSGAPLAAGVTSVAASATGRYVVYSAGPGPGAGVYVWDRQTDSRENVAVDSSGRPVDKGGNAAVVSADGRYVAFTSSANDLAPGDQNTDLDLYLRDRVAGTTTLINKTIEGTAVGGAGSSYRSIAISDSGQFLAFTSWLLDPQQGARGSQVYLWDRATGDAELVSRDVAGAPAGGATGVSLSADGSTVAFASIAPDLVPDDQGSGSDIFVWDQGTKAIELVSRASSGAPVDSQASWPSLSGGGRFVAYNGTNDGSPIVPGVSGHHSNVYLVNRNTGTTEAVTRAGDEYTGFASSEMAWLSTDGDTVTFSSMDPRFALGDTNEAHDVFQWNRRTGATSLVSRSPSGVPGDEQSSTTMASADGSVVVFESFASNLTSVNLQAGHAYVWTRD